MGLGGEARKKGRGGGDGKMGRGGKKLEGLVGMKFKKLKKGGMN